VYQIEELMQNIECHVCTHTQGFYGNTFLWFFNLHEGFAEAPLRPRHTVKELQPGGDYETKADEYETARPEIGFFHFRPDDYHRWFLSDMDWNTHVSNVLKEQADTKWRSKTAISKLLVKPQVHAPKQILAKTKELFLNAPISTVYNLTTDKDNIKFFEHITDRLIVLNTSIEPYEEVLNNTIRQKELNDTALETIRETHSVLDVDVDKLFFKYDEEEYQKVLTVLGTVPIANWKKKLDYAKEIIGEK
jgi:hypothetical protein